MRRWGERACTYVYPATWGYDGGTPPEVCGEIDCQKHGRPSEPDPDEEYHRRLEED